MTSTAEPRRIQAVLVLYKMTFAESASWQTWAQAMAARPDLRTMFQMLVVDNSPAAQALPQGLEAEYRWDGQNMGLASRYNAGLTLAAERGMQWLMLLDQDTALTVEYLVEVVRLSGEVGAEVVALAPKLMENGVVQSPHAPLFRKVQGDLLRVYNSGAVVRVAALEKIGGFPEEYWLDYLDHATFHRMQAAGGKVRVMQARLEHAMSIHEAGRERNPAYAARHRNQLAAEVRFYREHGSVGERWRHRKHLLAMGLRAVVAGRLGQAGRLLRAGVSWPAG